MNFDRTNRLPKCGQLEPPNRQQMRRLTISPGTCCRCGQEAGYGSTPASMTATTLMLTARCPATLKSAKPLAFSLPRTPTS